GLENRARFDEARAAYRRVIDSEAGRGTETAAESQFRIAESYLKENNLPVALREYYKVYAGYAVPRLASAALFQAASCDVTMKHYQEAMTTYRKLITEFPESEFTGQAKDRIKELEAALPQK
ncbi:MAG TPA: tetratricopeptide repeat protein, partial [Planctomicrobium sp.]|nr:tetratricopeptide repeat protein [Planctomicrobium sp.]